MLGLGALVGAFVSRSNILSGWGGEGRDSVCPSCLRLCVEEDLKGSGFGGGMEVVTTTAAVCLNIAAH